MTDGDISKYQIHDMLHTCSETLSTNGMSLVVPVGARKHGTVDMSF